MCCPSAAFSVTWPSSRACDVPRGTPIGHVRTFRKRNVSSRHATPLLAPSPKVLQSVGKHALEPSANPMVAAGSFGLAASFGEGSGGSRYLCVEPKGRGGQNHHGHQP